MLSMKKIYSPCFKCERRIVGCHGNCEDYIEYKKKIKVSEDAFSKLILDEIIDNVLIGNLERGKRKRERR